MTTTFAQTDRPMTRARKRAKRCYELSFHALTDMDEPGAWRLVHGIAALMPGFAWPVHHAWVADGREIFDPVENRFWPVADYCQGRFKALVIYTRRAASHQIVQHRHYGPWDEAAMMTGEMIARWVKSMRVGECAHSHGTWARRLEGRR